MINLNSHHRQLEQLQKFIEQHQRLLIITGAGLSVQSGIPSYRDHAGKWQRSPAIQHQEFLSKASSRQRYWARSLFGWPLIANAQPNIAHRQLTQWERDGRIQLLLTQNIDGLHRAAGCNNVLELHGRVDRVQCLDCYSYTDRHKIQQQLIELTSDLWQLAQNQSIIAAPDGDADINHHAIGQVQCPRCPKCSGILMPDVVFYGGTVPKARVELALDHLKKSDAVLLMGSSMMVYSAFRFCRHASQEGIPIAAINQGVTRADDLLQCKLEMECSAALGQLR